MTDDDTQSQPPQGNGRPAKPVRPPKGAQVRSGLAQKRNPAFVTLGALAVGARRIVFRDKIALFLLVASAALLIAFFSLLGAIGPSSHGSQLPISRVLSLADHRQIATATLLDHDSRVQITLKAQAGATTTTAGTATPGPLEYWAAYPASGVQTQQLLQSLAHSGAVVTVDQQAGKAPRAILVQFLIPILLLVCLFALLHALRRRRRRRRDRRLLRVHRQGQAQGQGHARPRHVRRRGGRRRGGGRAARDPRLPRRPLALSERGRGGAEGRAARRPARHRQDAARQGGRGRGRRRLLLAVGLGLRRVARRRRRRARARPLPQGAQDRARDHLHRRVRRRRAQARRRHRPGQRRARADAQRAARRDGRLLRRRRPGRDGRHQPPRHPRPRAAAPRALRPAGDDRRARRARAP